MCLCGTQYVGLIAEITPLRLSCRGLDRSMRGRDSRCPDHLPNDKRVTPPRHLPISQLCHAAALARPLCVQCCSPINSGTVRVWVAVPSNSNSFHSLLGFTTRLKPNIFSLRDNRLPCIWPTINTATRSAHTDPENAHLHLLLPSHPCLVGSTVNHQFGPFVKGIVKSTDHIS